MLNNARKHHSVLVQLFDLWLIQLSNWRWSWRSRLIIDTLAPLVSIVGLAVFARDAGPEALAYILTGNLVLNLMFGNLDKVGSNFAYMRMVGTLNYFATLPIRRYVLVLATVLSFLVMSLPSLMITTLLGTLVLNLKLAPNVLLLLVVPLVAIPLASLGALIGVSVSRPENVGSLSLLLTVVLTATGPVVIPPNRLPNWMLTLGQFSPATYAASGFRQALLGPVTPRIWLDLTVLALVSVIITWLVVRKMDWRQSE